MKRHPALQDLSRDHHAVLVFCQRMRRAAAARATEQELGPLVQELIAYYRTDLIAHWQEEEGFFVPLATALGSKPLVEVAQRIQQDHAWLRQTFEELVERSEAGAPVSPLLQELEPRLTTHVRTEERAFFEGVQEEVPEDVLQRTWRASFAYRSAHRSAQACTLRPPTRSRKR